jgi:hypothetical protein
LRLEVLNERKRTAKEKATAITASTKNAITPPIKIVTSIQPLKLENDNTQKMEGKRSRRASACCARLCPICLNEFKLEVSSQL